LKYSNFILVLAVTLLLSLTFVGGLVVYAVDEGPVTAPSGVPTEVPGGDVELTVPDGTLTVTGCASPSAFVTIFENNNPVGTVVADNFGRFSKKIGSQSYGLQDMQIFQEDKYNHISSTATFNTSLQAHEDNFLEVFLPPTVWHDKDPVIIGDYLIFRGFTCPNSTVNLNVNNNLTLAAKANEFGNWWIIADTSLYALGTHTYSVIASQGSRLSAESEDYIFRTSTSRTGATNLFPSELTTPRIIVPHDRYMTSTQEVTISGIGPANTQIELFSDGHLVGSAFSNPFGDWSMSHFMTNSQNSIKVRACSDDACTDKSESVLIFYQGETTTCNSLFELDSYRFWGLRRNGGVDLNMFFLSGQPEYEILIDWGDSTIEHITSYRGKDTRYHHLYKDIGQFNGMMTVRDASGCENTQYFSVGVTKDFRNVPWVLVILLATLISLVIALFYYIRNQKKDTKSLISSINGKLSREPDSSGSIDSDPPDSSSDR